VVSRLTYANVTATLALFLALGGASYAAVHIGKRTVGTAQLKPQAVSTIKIRDHAVTAQQLADEGVTGSKLAPGSVSTSKLADGTVTGAKIATATLGTVPNAVHAAESDHAGSAVRAQQAETAGVAEEAKYLDGQNAAAFGPLLMANTTIPETSGDADWWIPVTGIGQVSLDENEVLMVLPGFPRLSAVEFGAFSRAAPYPAAAAKVEVQLESFSEPIGSPIQLTQDTNKNSWWRAGPQPGIGPLSGPLAIHVHEEANGETIPKLPLATVLRLIQAE
jgi:hypothetical protein